jgi:hypothetical protein
MAASLFVALSRRLQPAALALLLLAAGHLVSTLTTAAPASATAVRGALVQTAPERS